MTSRSFVATTSAVMAIALASPPAQCVEISRARVLMGTVCTAVVAGGDTLASARAIDAAFEDIARLEGVMSSWRENSELAAMNRAATEAPFHCSEDLFAVMDSALGAARETDGAFDPSVEPLDRAWDLRGRGRVPDDAERAEALALVGWRGIALDRSGRTVHFARAGMGVDLGGIGKGLALDRAARVLRANGVGRALLNFGGETIALGDGEPWRITVADPRRRLVPAVALDVRGLAVSTSAQSERGFDARGRRYGHILNPRTGEPVRFDGSVTVVAASGTRADALSTALLVMGRDRAIAFARAHPEVGVLWLEPARGGVRAWRWNLPGAVALPGRELSWSD